MKRLIIDIDGTICTQTPGTYEEAKPIPEAVATVNKLYDEGHTIVFYTARYMHRCKDNIVEVYRKYYNTTLTQLQDWGLKFHELHMGKISGDYFIDNMSIDWNPNWNNIYSKCNE